MAKENKKEDIKQDETTKDVNTGEQDEDIFDEPDIEIPVGDDEPQDEPQGSEAGAEKDEAQDAPMADGEPAEEKKDAPPKKKFLKGKSDKKDAEIAELKEKLVRQMAEFDNFRKRTQREKSQMYDDGAKSIIEKVLPVVDNFERGLATIDEKDKDTPLAEGMEKIYKQFESLLAEAGVEQIEALGKEFDPELHNAVMHVEDEKLGENVVSQELQKGYTYHGTVVRHTMVVVAN